MLQELDEDQDTGERKEGGWGGDRLQVLLLESGHRVIKIEHTQ